MTSKKDKSAEIKGYCGVKTIDDLNVIIDRVKTAQEVLATYTQEQVDKIFAAMALAANDARIPLAKMAVEETGMKKLAIAGGVASNSALRQAMKDMCEKNHIDFYYPSPILCTDNAAMIGAAAYYEFLKGVRHGLDLNAIPNLKLGER